MRKLEKVSIEVAQHSYSSFIFDPYSISFLGNILPTFYEQLSIQDFHINPRP